MKCVWQKALGCAALGLMLTAPLSGCGARPAPRPEARATPNAQGAIDGPLSAAVAQTVRTVGGAGTAEALVVGNVALVAIQLNADQPGGTQGGPITGKAHGVDYPGSSPSGGPLNLHGPGGSVPAQPARPGGQQWSGGATPGGAAPLDVMTRISDQVRAKHPAIAEVRFATRPDDARRLADVARSVARGGTGDTAAVQDLLARTITAGTTVLDPLYPPQGTDGRLMAPAPTGTR